MSATTKLNIWIVTSCYIEAQRRGQPRLTLEPVCKPMAERWQMPFASSRGYSSLKLQHDVEAALENFLVPCTFVRIGLTRSQVDDHGLHQLGIAVKPSDSRSSRYVEEHGSVCWEADVLPASVIEEALNTDVCSWLDAKQWKQRHAEIERARKLL